MPNNLCQCGAVKTLRTRARTRAPRALVCLKCWRRTPLKLRKAFNASRRDSPERRTAIREILEWFKSDHQQTLTLIDTTE